MLTASGCAGVQGRQAGHATAASAAIETAKFEQDRKSILAMTGDFDVTFDFRETVALTPG